MTCFSTSMDVAHSARYLNKSCLFWSTRRKSFQFPGSLFPAATRCRTPEPRLHRVVAFRLFSRYSSHTMSSRLTWQSCALMYGMKEPSAYPEKVRSFPGLTMLTTAAPSIMTTFISFGILLCGTVSAGRHSVNSDFFFGRRKCP